MFSRKLLLGLIVGGGVFVSGLMPSAALAGTCAIFCTPSLIGSNVTRRDSGSCLQASDCASVECGSGYSVATDPQIRSYCNNNVDRGTELDGGRSSWQWCDDFLGVSSPAQRRERFDGRCAIAVALDQDPPSRQVSTEPPPPPARPNDQFRCRFLCGGEERARDGATCSAATDQRTCVQDCVATCGIGSCEGVTEAGTLRNGLNDVPLQPQCIPTRNNVNPETSIGGIVDTMRFETINEVFSRLSLPAFLGSVIRVLIGFSGALFLLMALWSGVRWMTAGENMKTVTAAQQTLKNAVIGIIAVALSYVLITAVIELFGTLTTGIAGS